MEYTEAETSFKPYQERVATVVGGRGQLGGKIVTGLEALGFRQVRICEKEDPFLDFVKQSTDIFFAVDDKEIASKIQASRHLLTRQHSILDGSSVKEPLIPAFTELDELGVSVCSTDIPGVLRTILEPFYGEGVNLTAIDSMPGIITRQEQERGVNPDGIVDFDIGLDPKTIDEEKEKRIREKLIALGYAVN